MNLSDGISFVLVVMATFAMSEALTIIIKGNDPSKAAKQISLTDLGSIKVNKEETKQMAATIPRSSILGFIIWSIARGWSNYCIVLSFGMERNFVKSDEKEKFGKGSVQGLSAPETANNAACSGSFVPLLTLGIPGSWNNSSYARCIIGFWYSTWSQGYMRQIQIFFGRLSCPCT